MHRNTLETADGVLDKHIRGELSKPLLRAWSRVNPVQTALHSIVEAERYRHLTDFLFMTIVVGVLGTVMSLIIAFGIYAPLQPISYGIGIGTATVIGIFVLVLRSSRTKTTYSRWAQEFIDAYDQFVRVTASMDDERFAKLKSEELRERAHATLAQYALAVREIEIAGEGISPLHWQDRKKAAAETFERVYQLMRMFKFVGDEGYKPYYTMAEDLLQQKRVSA